VGVFVTGTWRTWRAGGLGLAGAVGLAAAVAGIGPSVTVAAHRASAANGGPRIFAASRRTFGPGGWSWFADPRAVFSSGRVFAGWVDRDKYVVVSAISSGSATRVRIAREQKRDDHGNPALLVRSDGRITVFYSDHNGPSIRWRSTNHPGDVSSWGSEYSLHSNTPGSQGFTYPNPVWLSSEQRIYLFWRGGNWAATYSRTKSNGKFASARAMIYQSGQRPYVKVATNGRDEIYFAFTQGHPRETPTNLYFAKYRHGVFYRADGSRIGSTKSLPLRPSQTDLVYDAQRHDRVPAWIHDVAIDPDGNPVMVYATFRNHGQDHRYGYARWTGKRWKTHKIVDAGGPITSSNFERYYSGGVVLDHRDPTIVYGSVQVGSHWEIQKFTTSDGGTTWKRAWITENSNTDNVRPVVPRNLPSGAKNLLWMRGRYIFYTTFDTSVVGISRRR
jgi:hypothetical protein